MGDMNDEQRKRHADYMREYRKAHPESRDYQREYYRQYSDDPANKEKARKRARAWYAEHRKEASAKARARFSSKPKKGYSKGENHPRWKGDRAGYVAIHLWITKLKGRPSKCEHCGSTNKKKYEWANVDHEYRRVLEDYIRLCTSCHRQHDYKNGLSVIGGPRPRS